MSDRPEGGCACGEVRYRLNAAPMFVHCCHCTVCQRETGSAFAVNALVESAQVEVLAGVPRRYDVPTESGRSQAMLRCPTCAVALWSHYLGMGEDVAFVRGGTLDDPSLAPPSIHIYTRSKQAWVAVPQDVPAEEAFYRRSERWPAESYARFEALKAAR